MAHISEQEFNLIDILKNTPKEPFSINLSINSENSDITILFNKIKDIFTKGLIIQSGDEFTNTIDIKDIDINHIDIMTRHMLSMGIDVKLKKYSDSDKDCLFRDLLYDIQNIKNLNIKVVSDWNTNLIDKISISMSITNNDLSPLEIYNKAIKKHYEANHFLKLAKPNALRDFVIFVKKPDEDFINVIYFDFAKRGAYQKIHTKLFDNIPR